MSWQQIDKADEELMRVWVEDAGELQRLRLYKYLNQLGYRMAGIDQRINDEERKTKVPA